MCWRLQAYVPQVRGLPDLKMLGLPRNVLVWDGEQLGTWLDALGWPHCLQPSSPPARLSNLGAPLRPLAYHPHP